MPITDFFREDLQVCNIANICGAISQLSRNEISPAEVIRKGHFGAIKSLLVGHKVKYFLTESEYINKDYLVNYAKYYSYCFSDYHKKSGRIHFFRDINEGAKGVKLFSQQLSEVFFNSADHENGSIRLLFKEHYLGYIVINPIPQSCIGFSLLRTPTAFTADSNKKFWGTRKYRIHFFGHEVEIDSLAFHEQENNVGACATAAIWTVFQKASEIANVAPRTPIEITMDAGIVNYKGQRMLPNNGLVPTEICLALTKNNLETEIREFANRKHKHDFLKRLIHAYSPMGIPIILVINVPYEGDFALHAVAVSGHEFSSNKQAVVQEVSSWPNSIASDIETIYCHDDQFGPFVSMAFLKCDCQIVNSENCTDRNNFLKSYWSANKVIQNSNVGIVSSEHCNEPLHATPELIIIPVYPKVRISYEIIEASVLGLNKFLEDIHGLLQTSSWQNHQWDIQLFMSEDFKREILYYKDTFGVDIKRINAFKFDVVKQSMPKFIWVAKLCFFDGGPLFTFVFDATALENSKNLLHILSYGRPIGSKLERLCKSYTDDMITNSSFRFLLNIISHERIKNGNVFL